ncbi:MAG: ROK family protein [Rhodothermales bacterium]|nr:ROK family protein [Rhodothermales bacterium]
MEILGLDIGGSGIKGAPVNIETGELTADRHRVRTPQPATPKRIIKSVEKLVSHFEWDGPVGCAFPARIKHGVARTASNIDKSCVGYDIARGMTDRIGNPVFVVNDADAAGIAEMSFGAGREHHSLVLVLTVGTGIGSAMFMNRILIPNTEFGHIRVRGRNGERYAADSARKRDKLTWKKWAKRFQHYLDHIEFLVGPELIILGGGISNPSKASHYFDYLKSEGELKIAELSNRAGIVGAAMYAANRLKGGS